MGNTLVNRVGPAFSGVGTNPLQDTRQDEHGAEVMVQGSGKYSEPVKRQNVYSAFGTGLTPTTTAAGSTTNPFVLYNPVGSGKRLKILKVGYGQAATGTLGSGTVFHAGFTLNGPLATQSNTIPTGTAVTPSNMDVGGPNASVATVLTTATLHAPASLLYPFMAQGESVGGTTTSQTGTLSVEDVDGAIVLEQGAGWVPVAVSAAGSSPLVDVGVVWEEESLAS